MIFRFLLGAGLGGLVGTGLLVLVSIIAPAPGSSYAVAPAVFPTDSVNEPAAGALDSADADVPEQPLPVAEAPETAPAAGEARNEPAAVDAGIEEQRADATAIAASAEIAESGDVAAVGAPPVAPDLSSAPDEQPSAPLSTEEPAATTAPAPSLLAAPVGDDLPQASEQPAAAPSVATAEIPALPEQGDTNGEEPALAESGVEPGEADDDVIAGINPGQLVPPGTDVAPGSANQMELPPLTPEEEAMLARIAAEGPGSALPPDMVAEAPSVDPAVPVDTPAAESDAADQPASPTLPNEDRVLRIGDGEDATLPTAPSLVESDGAGGNKLPQIGDAPVDVAQAEDVKPVDSRPIAAFARTFDNPDDKPTMAIVLIDEGGAETDRAALAALPFAVTFALDPTDPQAAEHAAIYRAAGQEVAMLATALPKGGTAADVEVALSVMSNALPESVAIVDLPQRAFQADRALAALVVPAVGAAGRGILTWDQGLNAADQVARREEVPAAVAFRDLDGGDETTPVVRRYLDRAAFKAAQEGTVTVVGRTRAETVAALLEWAVEGRSATVALAPLSAVMSAQ